MTKQEQLVFYYRLLRQHALNDSHSGNGSVRMGEHFVVTKTGACADTIHTDELIHCALNDAPAKGASLDASIHQSIYQAHDKSHAVLHAHNPYTIALTLHAKTFKPVDFEGKLYFGELQVIECEENNYLEVMPNRISECLRHQPIAIVQSHGVYVAAENLELAYKWLCSVEQSAKIKWLANQA
ncbi:MAG: class II aldolase/adducin family protein [Porticoccaceae bacterium]|nr:class II aldolase/adducin family protein [Porticoccaceae bacterium]